MSKQLQRLPVTQLVSILRSRYSKFTAWMLMARQSKSPHLARVRGYETLCRNAGCV